MDLTLLLKTIKLQFPSNTPYFIQELRDVSIRYGEPVELQAQIGSKHEFGLKWTFPDRDRDDVVIAVG